MTTIAYKDGIMACDSAWSYDDLIDASATKITRLSSGALLGEAGENDSRHIQKIFDKIKTPASLPSRDDMLKIRMDYMGLLVFPKGRIFKICIAHASESNWDKDFKEDVGIWEVNLPFAAVGSGKALALGAMAAGKSAKEAVRIGCRFDINSRLPVHTVSLVSK